MMNNNKCTFCTTELHDIKKDIKIIDINGRTVYLKDVPASFCSECNSEFYSNDVSTYLDKLKRNEQETFKVLEWSDIFGK